MLKYICISDLHAGALTSLLRNLSETKGETPLGPVGTDFATALGTLVKASGATPQLILLGDLLDLQFADRARTTDCARHFLKALRQEVDLDERVIATAGNHDHSLWTDARLALEADAFSEQDKGVTPHLATPAFTETPRARSRLLDMLMAEAGFTGSVDFRYPNIGFRTSERAVILHHGHFVEAEYALMSRVRDFIQRKPRHRLTAEQIASENAFWLDFFWSTTGAAGFGSDAEALYQNLLTTKGYRRVSADLAERIGGQLADKMPLRGTRAMKDGVRMAVQVALDLTMGQFRDNERYGQLEALSRRSIAGLRYYLDGPVRGQMDAEISKDDCPEDVTFIFGHTHKPYADRLRAHTFAQPVKTFNLGGWTLNGPQFNTRAGASMVLIDDALHAVSVRLFDVPQNGAMKRPYVEKLDGTSTGARDFAEKVQRWIDGEPDVWAKLRDTAQAAFEKRQRLLLTITDRAPQSTLEAP